MPRLTAVLATLLLAATACTNDKPEPRPTSPTPDTFTVPTAPPARTLGAPEGTLTLLAQTGYVESGGTDKSIDWVTPFVKATGCQVEVTIARNSDELARMAAAGTFDAVAATSDVSLRLIDESAVAPVNTALIPTYRTIVPGLKNRPWNAVGGVAYGVPIGRTANVLVWRSDLIKAAPTSWASVYQPTYRGKIVAPDTPMTIGDAAQYLRATSPGLGITNPYALDRKQLQAATTLLTAQHRLGVHYWNDYRDVVPLLKNGRATIGTTSLAIAQLARAEGVRIGTIVPAEGTTGSSPTWMLGAHAAHPTCAYRWLDHTLSPLANARAAEWLGLAPANPAACSQFIDKDWCKTYSATDEAFWAKVTMQTTPLADCRDRRHTACTDYPTWSTAWTHLKSP